MEHPIVGGGYHSFLMHHVGGDPNHPMFLEAHNMLVETMADHGFVGLGLLLMLYLGCYMNCGAIRRRAKDDGRLPMEDHNTRIVVLGADAGAARYVAEAIAREAFHNVSYFPGSFDDAKAGVKRP